MVPQPPASTAAFSSTRNPGVVLRVSTTFALATGRRDRVGVALRERRDARQPLDEVERGALGREHAVRRAADGQDQRAAIERASRRAR